MREVECFCRSFVAFGPFFRSGVCIFPCFSIGVIFVAIVSRVFVITVRVFFHKTIFLIGT